jgi:hypothetical protein
VVVPASAAPAAFEVVDAPPKPKPAPAPVEEKPSKAPKKEALDLDDEPEDDPPKKSAKSSKRAPDPDDEPDERDERDEPESRKSSRKNSRRDDDYDDDAPAKKKPRKNRPLWVILLGLGCGGLLMLMCAGGALVGGFVFYLNSQQDKVAGKWVVDESAPDNAKLPAFNRAMQIEFEKKDMRCTMRVVPFEFTGKWRVIRNRDNDAILVLVDFEDARGPDGQKLNIMGKEKTQEAFEITPVDATHIDLVNVSERTVRMRMKKVDAFEKPTKSAEAPRNRP